MRNFQSAITSSRGLLLILLVLVLLAGLPVAVWLDLRNLTERSLLRQAQDLNSVITSMRAYYGSNVVGRVLSSPGATQVTHNYEAIPGAIPIPATLSLELGRVISEQQQNITYRFVSDYPFKNRTPITWTPSKRARWPRCARIQTSCLPTFQRRYSATASGSSRRW
jgi:hypothetical protein